MRKILIVLVLLVVMALTSCGMGWENFKKDFKSNVGGGLERVITVTNMYTGELVWEYEGVAYIDGQSSSGDVTVVYYSNGGAIKKADFLGALYGVQSFEK